MVPALTSRRLVLLDGVRRRLGVDFASAGEELEGFHDDGVGVVFEEAACGLAGVGESEAVGAEGGEFVGDELADLVRDGFHVVGDGDDRSGGAGELLGDERGAGFFAGVQEGVFFGGESVASEFVPGGHGPDVGGDSPVLGEDFLGFQGPGDRDAGGQDLRAGSVVFALPGLSR